MAPLAVLGNLSVDRVDRGGPRPGGCPPFAAQAFGVLGAEGHIVTRCAERDRELFAPLLVDAGVPLTLLPARVTSSFSLAYTGEERAMTVVAVGETWTPDDLAAVPPGTTHLHLAPLVRSDFPPATIAAAGLGRAFLSFDGQGLVRPSVRGPLRLDARYDRAALAPLQALKLSEEEARIVAGGRFHAGTAADLGVPEIVVTLGSRGATVHAGGRETSVGVAEPVAGVETTGAGDLFMVGYDVSRAGGAEPVEAARAATALVRRVLAERRG